MTSTCTTTLLKKSVLCAAILGCIVGCGTERSVNVNNDSTSLSRASNNINNDGAWSMNESTLEERWDEDPTVMQPNYPYSGFQPGFSE